MVNFRQKFAKKSLMFYKGKHEIYLNKVTLKLSLLKDGAKGYTRVQNKLGTVFFFSDL